MAWIRDGDKIISSTPIQDLLQDYRCLMEIAIQRGSQEISIGYWARARLAVDC
jgi:hypothetical protein